MRDHEFGHLKRDRPPVPDDFGADLDQSVPQTGHRPMADCLGRGQAAQEVGDVVGQGMQLNTMLVFTLYWRATTDTEAPGAAAAATISRFSASGRDLSCRLGPAFVSIIEFVDTSHTAIIIMQASIGAHRLHRKAALTGGIREKRQESITVRRVTNAGPR